MTFIETSVPGEKPAADRFPISSGMRSTYKPGCFEPGSRADTTSQRRPVVKLPRDIGADSTARHPTAHPDFFENIDVPAYDL